jgi:hypothetical protein
MISRFFPGDDIIDMGGEVVTGRHFLKFGNISSILVGTPVHSKTRRNKHMQDQSALLQRDITDQVSDRLEGLEKRRFGTTSSLQPAKTHSRVHGSPS